MKQKNLMKVFMINGFNFCRRQTGLLVSINGQMETCKLTINYLAIVEAIILVIRLSSQESLFIFENLEFHWKKKLILNRPSKELSI